jgi:hypothetical protein
LDEISKLTGLAFELGGDTNHSHILIYFGSLDQYNTHRYTPFTEEENILGLADIRYGATGNIIQSTIFVKSDTEDYVRRDVLREELTQALGFVSDTEEAESIFYQHKVMK